MKRLRWGLVIVLCALTWGAQANDFMLKSDGTRQMLFSLDKVIVTATAPIPAPPKDPAKPKDAPPQVGEKDPKTGQTIVFQKEKPVAQGAAEPTKEEAPTEPEMITAPREHTFETEVRDASAYTLEWVPSLHHLSEKRAYMIVQSPTSMIPISGIRTNVTLDLVMIRPNGRILAIMPEISLAGLGTNIDAGEEVRAVLFLKAGLAQKLGLEPNGQVKHSSFVLDPKVIK